MIKFEDVFDVMYYPAGEPHVELKSGNRYYVTVETGDTILCEARDFNDLGILRTAFHILLNNGVVVEWLIPYFPFGRHDRRRNRYDGLEVTVAAEILSGMSVLTIDPHSEVTAAYRHHHQAAFVKALRNNTSFEVVNKLFAIPDAGAAKKAYVWAEANGIELVQCLKKRDPLTGQLSGFQVLGDVDGRDVVIVDDICDKGGTFIGLGEELSRKGAKKLSLAVTHGIFGNHMTHVHNVAATFDTIYTMDTCRFVHPQLEKVQVQAVTEAGWKV